MDPTIALIGAYLAIHLIAYTAVFRRIAFFRTELGVFLLHLVSFLVLLGAAALLPRGGAGGDVVFTHVILAASLHGIYSISFLEVWSLTQGSYSLSILDLVARSRVPATLQSIAPLHAVGPRKRTARNAGLVSLHLLQPAPGGRTTLTAFGQVAARLIRFLLWFSGGRPLN